jgi:hypothetical protein
MNIGNDYYSVSATIVSDDLLLSSYILPYYVALELLAVIDSDKYNLR